VKLNHEARESRWVTLAEAGKMKLNMPTRVLINAVMKRRERQKTKSGK
jgi:hypothetical protein